MFNYIKAMFCKYVLKETIYARTEINVLILNDCFYSNGLNRVIVKEPQGYYNFINIDHWYLGYWYILFNRRTIYSAVDALAVIECYNEELPDNKIETYVNNIIDGFDKLHLEFTNKRCVLSTGDFLNTWVSKYSNVDGITKYDIQRVIKGFKEFYLR